MVLDNNQTLPKASTEFIIQKILESGKVNADSEMRIGNTITFLLKANKPLHKRMIIIREFEGEVNFVQATNNAILFGFMGDLLQWFRVNKGWSEGGYTLREHN